MIRIYVDSLLLLFGSTFALEFLSLWAIREIGGAGAPGGRVTVKTGRQPQRRTPAGLPGAGRMLPVGGWGGRHRLAAAAALPAAAFVVTVMLSNLNHLALSSPASLCMGAVVSGVALVIAFPGMSARSFIMAFLVKYLITIMAGGASMAASAATSGNKAASFLASAATVLLVAEAGWGIVHRSITDGLFFVPVSIRFDEDSLSLWALIDTGCRLCEPISGAPAIIVEYSAIEPILPPEIREPVLRSSDDFAGAAEAIADSAWSSRFSAVPYSSIGQQSGLLVGFRPSEVHVSGGKREISTSRAVVCIHCSSLSSDGKYRALMNPDILTAA